MGEVPAGTNCDPGASYAALLCRGAGCLPHKSGYRGAAHRPTPLDDPMANDEHLAILKQGVTAWNAWRQENFDIPDLSGANLTGANLFEANLSGANLSGANLCEADLQGADLSGADLFEAKLHLARLIHARLRQANLIRAALFGADLSWADLSWANLTGADLQRASLVDTGCRIYGVSAWGLNLKGAKQQNLIITPGRAHSRRSLSSAENVPEITADDIEVAQFLYLLLHNEKLQRVINAINTKAVLILGRFTAERKTVLDALREKLRECNYVPILFDFEAPARPNLTETITLLARMARFIIADLTDPTSIPQELQAIIPHVRVPIQPLLLEGSSLYSMFKDFDPEDFHWVLPVYRYKEPEQLLATLADVIAPAEGKAEAMEKRRRKFEAEL
jgi:hypothetical protein